MWTWVGRSVSLALIAAASPALAQMAPTGQPDIWQSGTAPLTGLASSRQSPNIQPVAPAQPVSNQATAQAALPSWYPRPPGTPLAGGTFYSGVTVGTFYDDNIFATHTNRLADWAFFARPEASWVKQGQNYSFATDGWIEGRDYAKYTSENQVNGGAGASFTTMPDNDTQIVGGARYIHEHLARGASETVVTLPGGGSELLSTLFAHPVAYDEGLESIALNKRYGNWWTSLGGAGLEINYQNATLGSGTGAANGTPVEFNYADGGVGVVHARLGYVFAPQSSVFVEAAGNVRDWDVSYFDSTGYRVDAGVLFEQGPGARLKGEAWLGYMSQQYNGATMATISSWTYGLGLAAVLADNITFVAEGRREAKEAALGLAILPDGSLGASSATCLADGIAANAAACVSDVESEIGGRIDYRMLQNFVIGVGATYQEDDYQGIMAFGRIDRSFGPLVSAKYFLSPNVTLGFDYHNLQFSSDNGRAPAGFVSVNALPYDVNIYMFTLNARW